MKRLYSMRDRRLTKGVEDAAAAAATVAADAPFPTLLAERDDTGARKM